MQTEILNILYSRPGMYLAPYGGIDAASFVANFLLAVFEPSRVKPPHHVNINVAGEHFLIHAQGYTIFEKMEKAEKLASLFDMSHYRKPFSDGSRSLGYLRPIVWFAEYCLVEMTVGNKIFRQTFLHGSAQAEQTEHTLQGQESSLSFVFTLSRARFQEVILDIERLTHVIETWEKRHLMRMGPESCPDLMLQKQWYRQSKHHYSLRLMPEMYAADLVEEKVPEINTLEFGMAETIALREHENFVTA